MKKGIKLLSGALSLWILVSFSSCNKTFLTVEYGSEVEDSGPPAILTDEDPLWEDNSFSGGTGSTASTASKPQSGSDNSSGQATEGKEGTNMNPSSKTGDTSGSGSNSTAPRPGKGSANKAALNDTTLFTAYDFDRFTQKIWEGKTVYYETICFHENKSGTISNAGLLYKPDQIIAIRSLDMQTTYVEGKDYTVKGNTITRTANSGIPYQPYNVYVDPNGQDWIRLAGSTLSVRSSVNAYEYQVTVFYTHSDDWAGSFVPESQESYLPKTMSKLMNQEPLKIVLYGDSLFTGCDTSGGSEVTMGDGTYGTDGTGTKNWGVQNTHRRAPYMPAWPELFKQGLEKKYGNTQITKINRASCSTESQGAVKVVRKNVALEIPDLVLIGFGMNQANVDPEKYRADIETMIAEVRKENPDAEFLLFSTMVPNTEINSYSKNRLPELEQALLAIRDSGTGIGVVSINSMFRCINDELGKKYFDYSLNNINHPSDFGIMIYAQMALAALGA